MTTPSSIRRLAAEDWLDSEPAQTSVDQAKLLGQAKSTISQLQNLVSLEHEKLTHARLEIQRLINETSEQKHQADTTIAMLTKKLELKSKECSTLTDVLQDAKQARNQHHQELDVLHQDFHARMQQEALAEEQKRQGLVQQGTSSKKMDALSRVSRLPV